MNFAARFLRDGFGGCNTFSAAELDSPSDSIGNWDLRRVDRRAGVSTMPSKSSFFLLMCQNIRATLR